MKNIVGLILRDKIVFPVAVAVPVVGYVHLVRSSVRSSVHSFGPFIGAFIGPFVGAFIGAFIGPFVHSFVHSLVAYSLDFSEALDCCTRVLHPCTVMHRRRGMIL